MIYHTSCHHNAPSYCNPYIESFQKLCYTTFLHSGRATLGTHFRVARPASASEVAQERKRPHFSHHWYSYSCKAAPRQAFLSRMHSKLKAANVHVAVHVERTFECLSYDAKFKRKYLKRRAQSHRHGTEIRAFRARWGGDGVRKETTF